MWVEFEGTGQGDSALFEDWTMDTEMHLGGREVPERGVVMLVVVPVEEAAAMAAGILGPAELVWKAWRILEGFELGLGEGIVIGDARP